MKKTGKQKRDTLGIEEGGSLKCVGAARISEEVEDRQQTLCLFVCMCACVWVCVTQKGIAV